MPEAPEAHAQVVAAIALGSNLRSPAGTPAQTLQEAIHRLGALGAVTAVSSFHRTAPVGYLHQPDFLNAAALLSTTLQPLPLLRALLSIERSLGRLRSADAPPKGPRTLDLDLLLYGTQVVDAPGLIVPHPAMAQRAFVLAPLAEIAPALLHPPTGRTIVELLSQLPT